MEGGRHAARACYRTRLSESPNQRYECHQGIPRKARKGMKGEKMEGIQLFCRRELRFPTSYICIPTNPHPIKLALFNNRLLRIFLFFLPFRVFRDSDKEKTVATGKSTV